MIKLQKQYAGKGFTVVAVPLERTREAAAQWKKDFKAPFPILFDPKGTIGEKYQVEAIPLNVAIDKTGKVVAVIEGSDTRALDAAAKKIAAKK